MTPTQATRACSILYEYRPKSGLEEVYVIYVLSLGLRCVAPPQTLDVCEQNKSKSTSVLRSGANRVEQLYQYLYSPHNRHCEVHEYIKQYRGFLSAECMEVAFALLCLFQSRCFLLYTASILTCTLPNGDDAFCAD